ncbi:MAG: tetratricopeptide repeat protein [Myxococcales bacterium]|nr:tetratricopeptide repeat protein [Myxococcales bacterium]
MTRLTRATAAAVVVTLVATLAPSVGSSATRKDSPRAVEIDADNVLSRVNLVRSDLRAAILRERRYPLARRYVDATIAYQRGNLPVASVLLYDLVMTREFQKRRDYYNALYMLGHSLYRMRNYVGAQRYLTLIVRFSNRRYFVPTLTALVDIAIRMRKFALVSQYATYLGSVPPGPRRSDMLYQFGRSFFVAKKFAEARKYLAQVGVGDKRYAASRFYLGVLSVQAKRFDDALRQFREVLSASNVRNAARRPKRIVTDYANLSLGRIYLEKKKYKRAIEHYSAVDRNSPVAEEALFELAATFLASKKPDRALDALDMLLLTVSDDKIAVEAAVLRGRINLLRKKYAAADGSYKNVVDRYSAISGELTRFVARPERLEQFFSWLLNRGSDDYSVVRPVSARVARYIERDPDMGRVVQLFDEMGAERRDVKQSEKLARTIEQALQSTARIEMFPKLKDNWLKLVEQENRIVAVGDRALDILRRYAYPVMNARQRSEVDAIRAKARELRIAFSKIPRTAKDWTKRETRIQSIWVNLAAEVSLLKAALAGLRDQILAIEKMLNERVFGSEGVVLSKKRELAVRKGLDDEKDNLRRAYRMVERLAHDLELGATAVGAGDKVSADESRVRGTLLALQRMEQALYAGALMAQHKHTDIVSRMRTVRSKLESGLLTINRLYAGLGKRVAKRTQKVQRVLRREKSNIANYKVRMNQYEHASRRLARTVGYTLIRRAQTRLADVVLEADLGLVDVAWQRKQDKAKRVRDLQGERNRKVMSLQKTLESLTDDEEDEP